MVFSVTPGSGGFPGGVTPQFNLTGLSTPTAQTTKAGSTAPLAFNLIATGSPGSNAYASVTLAGMTTQSGPQQFAIQAAYVPPAPSRASTKYIATPRASSVEPGNPVVIDIEFNGVVPTSGTISATSMGSNGTLSANTITLDGTAKSFTYTPTSAGEHNISFTNTAGLYDSIKAPLNCWAASSGSVQSLSATLRLGDQAVHYRDVPSGSPRGFSTPNTRGHGEVWVDVGQAVPALFARLYDRRSNGATTTQGTGTELTSGWVQVYGAMSAAGRARLLLPAIRAKQLWMDLSTSSTGADAIRVANCFAVGTIMLFSSRSQLAGYARGYAMPNADDNNNNAPILKSVPWYLTCESVAASPQYGGDTSGTWARVAGEQYDPPGYNQQFFGEPTSNGGMEAGRLIDQQTGMMLGITGCAWIGGGYDQFLDVPSGAVNAGTMATALAATSGKAHYYFLAGDSFDNIPVTLANYQSVFTKVPDWIMRNCPGVHVVGMATGASGYFGPDGSSDFGHTRMQDLIRQQEAALAHVVSLEDYHWNAFKNGHATQGARPPYVREHIRLLLSAEMASWGGLQTQARGPVMLGVGSHSGNVVRLPFKHGGGTTASVIVFQFPDLASFTVKATTNPTDLMSMISLRPAGTRHGDGSSEYPITGATINFTNLPAGADGTIDVTFSANIVFPCLANIACDFTASGGDAYTEGARKAVVMVDNVDPFGIGYGQHLRPAVDMVVN